METAHPQINLGHSLMNSVNEYAQQIMGAGSSSALDNCEEMRTCLVQVLVAIVTMGAVVSNRLVDYGLWLLGQIAHGGLLPEVAMNHFLGHAFCCHFHLSAAQRRLFWRDIQTFGGECVLL